MSNSQNAAILSHLKTGKSITPIDALERFNCFRLGARVYDLKQNGHQIVREMVPTDSGKHVASYTLVRS